MDVIARSYFRDLFGTSQKLPLRSATAGVLVSVNLILLSIAPVDIKHPTTPRRLVRCAKYPPSLSLKTSLRIVHIQKCYRQWQKQVRKWCSKWYLHV